MMPRIRLFGIAALALFGAVGIGIICGEIWLSDALMRVQNAKVSTVQFVANAGMPTSCVRVEIRLDSMASVASAMQAIGTANLRAFIESYYWCAYDQDKVALVKMLRSAAEHGDRTAQAALDAIAESACRAIYVVVGTPSNQIDGLTSACALVASRENGSEIEDNTTDTPMVATFRFTQHLTLVRAGTAGREIVDKFCMEVEHLPVSVYIQIVRLYPDLSILLQEYCGG